MPETQGDGVDMLSSLFQKMKARYILLQYKEKKIPISQYSEEK